VLFPMGMLKLVFVWAARGKASRTAARERRFMPLDYNSPSTCSAPSGLVPKLFVQLGLIGGRIPVWPLRNFGLPRDDTGGQLLSPTTHEVEQFRMAMSKFVFVLQRHCGFFLVAGHCEF
jgi:hypothetical protein